MAVTIERTDKNFIIKLPLSIDPVEINNVLQQFKFIDMVSRSEATQKDIAELSKEVKSGWSEEAKDKLKQMDEFKDLFK